MAYTDFAYKLGLFDHLLGSRAVIWVTENARASDGRAALVHLVNQHHEIVTQHLWRR